jgi:ribulose-phosphate 3-epimerase
VKIKLAPSLLAADCANLQSEIEWVAEKLNPDMLHIDVMDGHFVPNISFGVPVVAAIRKITKIPLDVHLMLSHPHKFIKPFAEAGADIITFHIESHSDIEETLELIRTCGISAGLALKPHTAVRQIKKWLNKLDMVLQMTVEPGFGGQPLLGCAVDSVRQIREWAPELDLQVDGGVNEDNVEMLKQAGANVLVMGHAIFVKNRQ